MKDVDLSAAVVAATRIEREGGAFMPSVQERHDLAGAVLLFVGMLDRMGAAAENCKAKGATQSPELAEALLDITHAAELIRFMFAPEEKKH